MGIFKKDKSKAKSNKKKNVISDTIRIRIHRLVGNVPSEIYIGNAQIQKDNYNNSVIVDDNSNFKEEFPNTIDPLISDIKYKLESGGLSYAAQLDKLKRTIEKKHLILSRVKNGKITVKDKEGQTKELNINVETEKANLRLLKVTKYILENKGENGSFEKIEEDGVRCLSYLISDGELIPYWYNSPKSNGEPVTLTPDMSLRKKYYYDNERERYDDLKNMVDNPINRILKVIAMALIVIVALAEFGGGIFLINKYNAVKDESLQPQLDKLNVQIAQAKQDCQEQLKNQVQNNEVILDWAKVKLSEDIQKTQTSNTNKSNIKI